MADITDSLRQLYAHQQAHRQWAEEAVRKNGDRGHFAALAYQLQDVHLGGDLASRQQLLWAVERLSGLESRFYEAVPTGARLRYARDALLAAVAGDVTGFEGVLDEASQRFYAVELMEDVKLGRRPVEDDGVAEEASDMPNTYAPRYKIVEWVVAFCAVAGLGGAILGYLVSINSTLAVHTVVLDDHKRILIEMPSQIGKEVGAAVAPLKVSVDHLSERISGLDRRNERTEDQIHELEKKS